jgi:uncharacterized protein DUF3634
MPLLLLGLLIGVVLVVLYKRTAPAGVRVFDGNETYIRIDDGALRLRKGWVPNRTMTALADLLRDAGVSQGYITLSPDRRVAVSWHVPPALHQKIRNVLLCDG